MPFNSWKLLKEEKTEVKSESPFSKELQDKIDALHVRGQEILEFIKTLSKPREEKYYAAADDIVEFLERMGFTSEIQYQPHELKALISEVIQDRVEGL